MTGRTKYTPIRIEADIEKNREQSNWPKVIELAEQLKENSSDFVYLSKFLIGEGRLESYLEETPPIDVNVHRAKLGLIEAKMALQAATSEQGKKAGVALDAYLLLGKIHYACGHYEEGLNSFKQAELQTLSEKKLPLRSLKIVAESFAIKGLCLQKHKFATTKYKKAEKDDEMLRCFELATDLGLLYMQELDKQQTSTLTNTGSYSPQPTSGTKALSTVLEAAMQAAPLVLIHSNRSQTALERYRSTLCAVESQSISHLRLRMMCQLAEMLLRGLPNDVYKQPIEAPYKESAWKPKIYTAINQFMPRNECEETILVLLVAEAMAVRNAVLSQSPEFKEVRLSAYQDAMAVYDLLTIATVRWGQIMLLQESLERSMKFSFEEPHLWKQHALSLISVGRYDHAIGVLNEVIRLEPNKSINCLLAAKLCYEHLDLPKEGIEFSKDGLEKEMSNSSGLLGRCHMYIGLGYHLFGNSLLLKTDKHQMNEKALEHFKYAAQLEPNDHLCVYYLGLQYALNGSINEALQHVNIAWELHPDNSSILHLLALLLSANRQHDRALEVVEAALIEYPDCLNLMYVKAYLELHEEGGENALITAKRMLELWKNLYEGQTTCDMPECDLKSDTRSVFQLYTSEMSDKDSSSLQAHSIAASRVEQALSEVASSLSSFSPRPGPQRAWMLLLEVWLLLAEIYLALDQPADVLMCIQEASQIFPLSHHIMHMRGLFHMHKKEWSDAKTCFLNAIAINPQHVKSLQQLGLVYHYLGLQGLAETTLREAAKIEPNNHVTWYNLGKVLESLGEYETASSAMNNALHVEITSPILPFQSVPLCFD